MRKEIVLAVVTALVVFVIVGFFVSKMLEVRTESKEEKLAKCLANKATMYGAYWCPHCNEQKKLFGKAFKFVNYVECTKEKERCMAAGIKGYPTWIINGKQYLGVQTLEQLANLADCEY